MTQSVIGLALGVCVSLYDGGGYRDSTNSREKRLNEHLERAEARQETVEILAQPASWLST